MKKAFFLLAVITAVFTGCNPLEDINNEIDKKVNPVVGNAEYTLTDDDYTDLGLNFGSFSSLEQVKDSVPQLLENMYSFWGQGSSVLVNYNFYKGNAEGVSDLTGATVYSLLNSDYASTGSDAFGFYPNVMAESKIPSVLNTQIENPEEGQIVLAKYKQYKETPVVGLASIVDYNFVASLEGWSIIDELGTKDAWTSQAAYVQGNGFFGGQTENIEWLVSPSIDLEGQTNLKFQITHALKYQTDASLLKVLVSKDYTGDTATANWDEIVLVTPPGVDSLEPSEEYDFSAYDGQKINVAFKYESTTTDSGRWRISNMAIKVLGASGETNSKGVYFMYSNGNWELVENTYYLGSEDYDTMGTASGQPGRYNNFSSSISPENYLPKFLELNFPYGQEDEELFVIYDYYSSSSGAQMRGNLYTFSSGIWNAYQATVEDTLQFGFDNEMWVPDNTIKYILKAEDYDLASSVLINEPDFEGPASNMGTYNNFNRSKGGSNYWSDEMLVKALGIILDNNDSTALDGQKYFITIDIYNGSSGTEDISLIKKEGVWTSN